MKTITIWALILFPVVAVTCEPEYNSTMHEVRELCGPPKKWARMYDWPKEADQPVETIEWIYYLPEGMLILHFSDRLLTGYWPTSPENKLAMCRAIESGEFVGETHGIQCPKKETKTASQAK